MKHSFQILSKSPNSLNDLPAAGAKDRIDREFKN